MPRPQSEIFAEKLMEREHPFQHEEYAFTHWTYFVAVSKEDLPIDDIARSAPKFTFDECLTFLDKKDIQKLNNCGKRFEVEGMRSGQVCWLVECENRTKEDPVIVFCHGGSYLFGLYAYHVNFIRVVWEKLANKERVSVLVLDYSTSLEAKYPTQLDEMVKLSNELSKTCDKIVHFGANCGAHIVLNMLRHTKIPVEGVTSLNEEAYPYLLAMVSPVTNVAQEHSTGTYLINKQKDFFDIALFWIYNRYWLNDNCDLQGSQCLSPSLDKEVDWSELIPKGNTAVWLGEDEILASDTYHWCKEMAKLPQDHFFVSPTGTTDSPLATIRQMDEEFEMLCTWLGERL